MRITQSCQTNISLQSDKASKPKEVLVLLDWRNRLANLGHLQPLDHLKLTSGNPAALPLPTLLMLCDHKPSLWALRILHLPLAVSVILIMIPNMTPIWMALL